MTHLDDLVRVLLRQLLNAGAALRAPNHDRPSSGSVQQDCKVHLIGQLQLGGHKQRVDWLACRQQANFCEKRAAILTSRINHGAVRLACTAKRRPVREGAKDSKATTKLLDGLLRMYFRAKDSHQLGRQSCLATTSMLTGSFAGEKCTACHLAACSKPKSRLN